MVGGKDGREFLLHGQVLFFSFFLLLWTRCGGCGCVCRSICTSVCAYSAWILTEEGCGGFFADDLLLSVEEGEVVFGREFDHRRFSSRGRRKWGRDRVCNGGCRTRGHLFLGLEESRGRRSGSCCSTPVRLLSVCPPSSIRPVIHRPHIHPFALGKPHPDQNQR